MENNLSDLKVKALDFLKSCRVNDYSFRLCPNSEESPYARCFAIFLTNLLKDNSLKQNYAQLKNAIVIAVEKAHSTKNIQGKDFRQLLAFSLSALSILDNESPRLLNQYIKEQIDIYNKNSLNSLGCLRGLPGSGNQAMFYAIFLIHAQNYINIDTKNLQKKWIENHLSSMNKFGFWGKSTHLKHLHFQNGYHQYEILEYLNVDIPNISDKLKNIQTLKDGIGHYAPYPGGGGCYDYDAIFLLTSKYTNIDAKLKESLLLIYNQIISEQNGDGGFAENKLINKKDFLFYKLALINLFNSLSMPSLFKERLRLFLSLHLKKNKRIKTHWTQYSRRWDESNLWDTWFRILSLARIQIYLENQKIKNWGMIKYQGIGYHHLLGAVKFF